MIFTRPYERSSHLKCSAGGALLLLLLAHAAFAGGSLDDLLRGGSGPMSPAAGPALGSNKYNKLHSNNNVAAPSASAPPPPAVAVPPANNVSLNHLKTLLPLPKVHHSWMLPAGQFASVDAADSVLVDYARITGSVPICLVTNCGDWPGNAAERVATAVEACHRAGLVPPPLGRPEGTSSAPSLAVNFSPWYSLFKGSNASSTEGEAAELELWRTAFVQLKGWIASANAMLNSTVKVSAVMMDSEKFNFNPVSASAAMKTAIRRKNELIYNVTREAFPATSQGPGPTIMFYDYGAAYWYPRSEPQYWQTLSAPGVWTPWNGADHAAAGWLISGIGTYDESFASEVPFCTSLYELDQPAFTRQKYAVTAASAAAQRAGPGVVPFISLGAGYRSNATLVLNSAGVPVANHWPDLANIADQPFADVVFDVGNDYAITHSMLLGAELNNNAFNGSGRKLAFANWGQASAAVFFPSPFETSCGTGAGGCVAASARMPGSTKLFDHFVAYVVGAAQHF